MTVKSSYCLFTSESTSEIDCRLGEATEVILTLNLSGDDSFGALEGCYDCFLSGHEVQLGQMLSLEGV